MDEELLFFDEEDFFIKRYLEEYEEENRQLEQVTNEFVRIAGKVEDLYEKQRVLERNLTEQEDRIEALIQFASQLQTRRRTRR